MMNTALATLGIDETTTLAATFVKSGFFKDAKDAAQAVVKIMAGRELGFAPIASMTGIHIVEGKVSLSANLIAAAIKRSGKYTYRVIEHTGDVCKIEFFEGGQSIGISSFSGEDAKAAGCDNKPVWRAYRRNMLFARALSNGARWHCPDVFGGPLYTPEELGATVDGETGEVIPAGPSARVEALPPPAPPADPDEPADYVPAHWTTEIDAAAVLGPGRAHGELLRVIARIDEREPNPYRKHAAIMKAAYMIEEPDVTSLADFAKVVEWAAGRGDAFPFASEILREWRETLRIRTDFEGDTSGTDVAAPIAAVDELPDAAWPPVAPAPARGKGKIAKPAADDDVIDAEPIEAAAAA